MRQLALTLVAALVLAPAAFAQAPAAQPATPHHGKPGMTSADREAFRGRMFDAMDANKDSKLTEQEVVDHAVARAKQQFARMDAGKSGAVSKEEFLAKQMRGEKMDRPHKRDKSEGTR